jgi:hypothetical protein
MAFYVPERTTEEKKRAIQREIDLIKGFEDKWDFDFEVAPSSILSVS